MSDLISLEREIAGRRFALETGKLALQADGAVIVQYGDTVVLCTACVADNAREGVDFLPLTIDYEERLYAAGKIPGGFIRREGRPTTEATLASRLTDRPLRPLLPKEWRRDIQVIITVLSADMENDPTILGVIGASAAVNNSQVPFDGPVGATRVGYINGEFVINPKLAEMEQSLLDLVVVSTRDSIVMVESGSKEVAESLIMQAMQLGHKVNQEVIALQDEMRAACGKEKEAVPVVEKNEPLLDAIKAQIESEIDDILAMPVRDEREAASDALLQKVLEALQEQAEEPEIKKTFDDAVKARMRYNVLEYGKRIGGRSLTQLRQISCAVGLLPRTHGSGLFNRGLTQVMTIATLGSAGQEQQLDGLGIEETKRFMHHYNFPPFSSGETRRVGTPSRREIGHGALAERAIQPVLPDETEFPYTIRLVSEVLSSNGSTSMASTCASSLSLMDAGIPIKTAVSGIAMGLITDGPERYAVLTDIEGVEDHLGDMDFKVAGTKDGVTALQLDIKLKGVSLEMLGKAVDQAKEARLQILDIMNATIDTSRAELSKYAPRMHTIKINPEKIGSVIGPGGKTIRSIIAETKTTIDINDEGMVVIGATDGESAQRAIEMIENLTREVEVGALYTGKVTRILSFGAMVEILPNKEGMVHISELADYRVGKVEDEVSVGDEITVKVIEIDNMGRVNLSRRAVFGDSNPERRQSSQPYQRQGGGSRRPRDGRPPRPPRR